jgi:acyl-CoA reductase-like NAD-dependent aldehyde dehydrogenase
VEFSHHDPAWKIAPALCFGTVVFKPRTGAGAAVEMADIFYCQRAKGVFNLVISRGLWWDRRAGRAA